MARNIACHAEGRLGAEQIVKLLRQIAEQARKMNPKFDIIARAHSDAEVEYLQKHKANFVIMGEREIAFGILEHALRTSDQTKSGRQN